MRLYGACVIQGCEPTRQLVERQPQLARKVVLGGGVPLVGLQEERARGKRRGFSPEAAAHHSQSARAHTVFYLSPYGFFWNVFLIQVFPTFFDFF